MLNLDKANFPQNHSVLNENRVSRFLNSALPHFSEPGNREGLVQRNTNRMLKLLTMVSSEKSRKEIRKQIELAVRYTLSSRGHLFDCADKNGGSLYLRPQDYHKGAGKITTPERIHPRFARYIGSHIMVTSNPQGSYDIDIIPKHPDLWLGKGTYKYARVAIRSRNGLQYFTLKAFLSAGGRNNICQEIPKRIEREVTLINSVQFYNNLETCRHLIFFRAVGDIEVKKAKVIMPLANRGDLYEYLFKGGFDKDETKIGEKQSNVLLLHIMIACARSVLQQHKQGLTNGDIKLENSLLHIENLGGEEQKVICTMPDLGFAYYGHEAEKLQTPGTYRVQGPEISDLSSLSHRAIVDGQAQDIFSLGILFHSIAHLTSFSPKCSARSFVRKKQVHPWLKYITKWAQEPEGDVYKTLIDKMLHPDPSKRPTIEDVLNELQLFTRAKCTIQWKAELIQDKRTLMAAAKSIDQIYMLQKQFFYSMGDLIEFEPPGTYVMGESCACDEPLFVFKDDVGKIHAIFLNRVFITDQKGASQSLKFTPPFEKQIFVRYLTDRKTFFAYRITDEGVDEIPLSPCSREGLMQMSRHYYTVFEVFKRSFQCYFDTATLNFHHAAICGYIDLCKRVRQYFESDSRSMLRRAKELALRTSDYNRFFAIAKERIQEFDKRLAFYSSHELVETQG